MAMSGEHCWLQCRRVEDLFTAHRHQLVHSRGLGGREGEEAVCGRETVFVQLADNSWFLSVCLSVCLSLHQTNMKRIGWKQDFAGVSTDTDSWESEK